MQVSVLLQDKGSAVVTVTPDAVTADAVATLAERKIGAVVVSADGASIDGVLSERDIVRALAAEGAAALERAVSHWMTSTVVTCSPQSTVEELMATMTERRIRHVPVVIDGDLGGVISIGDVVKDRISALEQETKVLHDYIENPY